MVFLTDLSLERQRVAKIIKKNIERAVAELGPGYNVELQGKFDSQKMELTIAIANN